MVSQSEVLSYASRHGVAAAAVRFGVNDRTIRKWRARAVAPASPAPVSSVDAASKFAPLNMAEVATGRNMWRCAGCNELHRVPAGLTRGEWEKRGCALHSVPATIADIPAPDVPAPVPAPVDGPPSDGSTSCPAPAPVAGLVVAPAVSALHKEEVLIAQVVSDNSLRSVLLAWLLEYWRVPLAVAVGVILLVLCF